MAPLVFYGDKMSVKVTRDFRQLVNISLAAGKFVLLHPQYEFTKLVLSQEMFRDEMLEDFEVHNRQYEVDEIITYDTDEVKFFYVLLEITCRIFLCEIGDELKKMAIDNGETNEDEFKRVRSFYLKQAEKVISNIRQSYYQDPEFLELFGKVELLTDFN